MNNLLILLYLTFFVYLLPLIVETSNPDLNLMNELLRKELAL